MLNLGTMMINNNKTQLMALPVLLLVAPSSALAVESDTCCHWSYNPAGSFLKQLPKVTLVPSKLFLLSSNSTVYNYEKKISVQKYIIE